MQSDDTRMSQKTGCYSVCSFDELYDEYKTAVFGFAFYLTQNRSEAEELFQEAWLRIVKKMPEKVNRASIKSWIFTIVANLHKDMLRKKRIRRLYSFQKSKYAEREDAPLHDAPDFSFSNSAGELPATDLGKDVARAIASLPDRQRRVFVLKEMAGFKQAEIGDMLRLPLGTVKSLMHRAVKSLQRELSAYNPERERIKCNAKTLSV